MRQNFILAGKIISIVHAILLIFLIFNLINLKDLTLIDWDEGVFAVQAQWLASLGEYGKPFNFQTPPLFQILLALLFKLLGIHDWLLPLLSIIFSCLTIYFIFQLTKELYSEERAIYTVVLFMTTEFFLFFSKSGLSDAAFLFFFIGAIYFFFKGLNWGKGLFLSGLFTTLSLYTKYTGPLLLLIFIILGIIYGRLAFKKIFLWTVLLPAILFLPYIFLFLKFVTPTGIIQRHGSLIGLNHHSFLCHLLIFSPVPFILAIIAIFKMKKGDWLVIWPLLVFFAILGCYYPFFRLAYPLVPFLCILSAKTIVQTKKAKIFLLVGSLAISFLFGYKTLFYRSQIPEEIGSLVNEYCKNNSINYIYACTPPNIIFYLDAVILLSEEHPSCKISTKLPGLTKKRKVIERAANLLEHENKSLFISASFIKNTKDELLGFEPEVIDSIEFIDAPVYYKDLFNPLRTVRQIYEILVFDIKNMVPEERERLWQLGFKPKVQVLVKERAQPN